MRERGRDTLLSQCHSVGVNRRRGSKTHFRALILFVVGALSGVACGGDSAPPAPLLDAARPDSASVDAAPIDASPRRDAATLPPADLEVVLPYLGPAVEEVRTIRGAPGRLDVHFSIDTTGSFGGEIDALQSELSARIIPAIEDRVADVAFGVSRFEDFDLPPFGSEGDDPFELLSAITTDRGRTRAAVARLDNPFGAGGDGPESGYEALFQIATGFGYTSDGIVWIPPQRESRIGGVHFRPGAIHAVVHATDAPSHVPGDYAPALPGTHGFADVVEAMAAIDAVVLGISSHDRARSQLESLALTTGAHIPATSTQCATGQGGETHPARSGRCPLVFDVQSDGTGLSAAIVDGLVGLLDTVTFDEVYGQAVDDRLGFVRAIEAISAVPPADVTAPDVVDRRPVDGVLDTFLGVRIDTQLDFAVRLRNETLPPADYDQVFRLSVQIVGDALVLDEVTIRIVVPRGRLDAGPRDAGPDAMDAGPVDAPADAAGDAPDAEVDAEVDADVGDADAGLDAALDAGVDSGA